MAYTFSFADNTSYGASDINAVINKICTAGVADVYYNGTSYNTSDLNLIAETIADSGILYGSGAAMKVTFSDTSGKVKIAAGTAIMSDGATITVNADGYEIDYTAGQINYVYIENNLSAENSIDIICSLTSGGSDTIPLATISAAGAITDTRTFCKGKLAGYQSNLRQPQIITVSYSMPATTSGYSEYSTTVDLGDPIYSKIIDYTAMTSGTHIGVCNLTDSTYYSVISDGGDYESKTDGIYAARTGSNRFIYLTFSLSTAGVLTCNFKTNDIGAHTATSGTIKLLVC